MGIKNILFSIIIFVFCIPIYVYSSTEGVYIADVESAFFFSDNYQLLNLKNDSISSKKLNEEFIEEEIKENKRNQNSNTIQKSNQSNKNKKVDGAKSCINPNVNFVEKTQTIIFTQNNGFDIFHNKSSKPFAKKNPLEAFVVPDIFFFYIKIIEGSILFFIDSKIDIVFFILLFLIVNLGLYSTVYLQSKTKLLNGPLSKRGPPFLSI